MALDPAYYRTRQYDDQPNAKTVSFLLSYHVLFSDIATAYGMMTAIQNAGLALINFLIGVFLKHFAENNDKLNGYNWLLIALAGMDVLAIVLAQVLLYVDNSRGQQLCAKGNSKKEEPEISGSVNAAADSFSGKQN